MKKIIFLILTINILSIVSCCNEEQQIVGIASFDAFSLVNRTSINTVTDNFMLEARLDLEFVSIEFDNPFANELYGTSCEYDMVNQIIEGSITLVCDKDFMLNGETVSAGANMIDLESVLLDNTLGSFSILFGDSFTDAADFPDPFIYTFTIDFDTSDGLSMTDSISLDMQL
jgi:hypothetical protein